MGTLLTCRVSIKFQNNNSLNTNTTRLTQIDYHFPVPPKVRSGIEQSYASTTPLLLLGL